MIFQRDFIKKYLLQKKDNSDDTLYHCCCPDVCLDSQNNTISNRGANQLSWGAFFAGGVQSKKNQAARNYR